MNLFDQPSFQSIFIEAYFGDTRLSTASGFVVGPPTGSPMLITNWHVVAGRHIETRKPLHSSAGVPDRLAITHNARGNLGKWTVKIEPLYTGEHPRWLEHPAHGSKVDVVGVPLTDLDGVDLFSYSYSGASGRDVAELPKPMKWGPSDFVNIIGFPFGWTGGGALGIWVQGAVATEPQLEYNGLPRFLIDSRTREGQSGSPVVIYKRNGWITLEDGRPYMIHNTLTHLVGVYSGRLNKDSDLGTVWNASTVEEIALRGRPGVLPEPKKIVRTLAKAVKQVVEVDGLGRP